MEVGGGGGGGDMSMKFFSCANNDHLDQIALGLFQHNNLSIYFIADLVIIGVTHKYTRPGVISFTINMVAIHN